MRVAIVGCGRAAAQHVEALTLERTGRVVAVVDDDDHKAAELARRTGARIRCLDDVLGDARVDAVAVCTPPDAHASIAVAALRAGKGVVIEKPVARSGDELEAIIAASQDGGTPAVAMLQHRGRLPLAALSAGWTSDAVASIEVLRPRPRDHYLSDPWRHHPERSGGGHVAHLAVHHLDLACQLLGMPAEINGVVECRDAPTIETRAALSIRFDGGSMMTLLASAHPARRCERLHVGDGERDLLVTDTYTEYRDGGAVERAPTVPSAHLRAGVYRDLRAAVCGVTAPNRYGLSRTRGVTSVLEEVRALTATSEAVA